MEVLPRPVWGSLTRLRLVQTNHASSPLLIPPCSGVKSRPLLSNTFAVAQTYKEESSSNLVDNMAENKPSTAAKTSHVNMMVDTVVANLPAEGLRSIIRTQLATSPAFTPFFLENAQRYLRDTNRTAEGIFEYISDSSGTLRPLATAKFDDFLRRIRAMVGSGLVFDAIPRIKEILQKASVLDGCDAGSEQAEALVDCLSQLEGDIVQGVTAIQKVQVSRRLTEGERDLVVQLAEELKKCKALAEQKDEEDLFERGLEAVESLLG